MARQRLFAACQDPLRPSGLAWAPAPLSAEADAGEEIPLEGAAYAWGASAEGFASAGTAAARSAA
jgi:hypothetical protein